MTNSIPANFYVGVTPNVLPAGGATLTMEGLVLDNSARVPIGEVLSFPNDGKSVANYFGAGSTQAAGSAVYFAGFNNANTTPGNILFTQYPTTDVGAWLRGGQISSIPLATLQSYSGSFTIVIDGYTWTTAAINLSSATSFSNAASLIQTGLQNSPPSIATGFTGALSGGTLTVTGSVTGTIAVGQTIVGTSVASPAVITGLGTGTGGTGTYLVAGNSQTIGGESMSTQGTLPTVIYDTIAGAFEIASGITGTPSTIAFPTTDAFATNLMLTSATGAVTSQGAAAATPAAFMTSVVNQTTNFATFMTDFNPDESGNANKLAFATWNNTQNNRYAYVCWDTDITPTESVPASSSLGQLLQASNISGTIPIWTPSDLYYAWFVCGMVASIDFTETNGRITLAYKGQTGLTPSVTSATVAANLGGSPLVQGSYGNYYNYYAASATANQQFQWFQRGLVSGPYIWADSYINQIWLNANLQLALMELLSNVKSIPYNPAGYALIRSALVGTPQNPGPIDAAVNFGAINPGVTLSSAQVAEVNAAAGLQISGVLQTQGWYLQILAASPTTRAARGSPPMTLWYVDGGSVQAINLASIEIQ